MRRLQAAAFMSQTNSRLRLGQTARHRRIAIRLGLGSLQPPAPHGPPEEGGLDYLGTDSQPIGRGLRRQSRSCYTEFGGGRRVPDVAARAGSPGCGWSTHSHLSAIVPALPPLAGRAIMCHHVCATNRAGTEIRPTEASQCLIRWIFFGL